ncbi:MAG: type II/IV secretion system ATPase subunit, partial [Methanomicrobiales archaeon]|nr:type II/IV secretion system ATPase subunit [Methanomicrobiales archaeon]
RPPLLPARVAYDPAVHGPLAAAEVPPGYSEVASYWVVPGQALVIIALNRAVGQHEYLLFEPSLSAFERDLLERIYADLRDVLVLDDSDALRDRRTVLLERMAALVAEYGIALSDTARFRLEYYLFRNFLGWSRIDALMRDPQIEDISCDGSGIPLFLYHRTWRNIKTNISFSESSLGSLAVSLAQRSGRHISIASPMLDATLPDGSRLQLTLGTEVTTRGTSFTIRKFREEPFSPVELLERGTFPLDALVYFWLAIEQNKNLLFIGGTASGKTTSLNAVSQFIPPLAKVVSIEDTREITLFHENWIASVTRESVAEGTRSAIDMFELLRAAMRQRPEYIIVGEVRGKEAQTLFQAMNTGHTTFSTMHAGDVDAAIHRLENPPLSVPRTMVQALDVIAVQALIHRGGERVRRCLEVVEVEGIDPASGNLRVNTVFAYDPAADAFSFSGRSRIYAMIRERRGWSREEMETEIGRRREVLAAMREQKVTDYRQVSHIFQAYAVDPGRVLAVRDNLSQVL